MGGKDKEYDTDCTARIKTLLQPLFNETDEKSQGTDLLALETEAAGDFNAERASSPQNIRSLRAEDVSVLYGDIIP